MRIAIIANVEQVTAFKKIITNANIEVDIVEDYQQVNDTVAAIFDFKYINNKERNAALNNTTIPVFINSVIDVLDETTESYIRFNGWNSFIERPLWEISASPNATVEYKNILLALCINYKEVANITGLITPRIISTIINEAYIALEQNVSTKQEIDMAMKLGTNYPYGPFEWCNIIGIHNVHNLLLTLSKTNKKYTLANALVNDYNLTQQ